MSEPKGKASPPAEVIEVRLYDLSVNIRRVEIPSTCPMCRTDFREPETLLIENLETTWHLARVKPDEGGGEEVSIDGAPFGGEEGDLFGPIQYQCRTCKHVLAKGESDGG